MTEITPTTPGSTSGRKGTPAPADTFETISHVQKRLILTQAGCMTDKQAAQIYYGRAEETLALAAGSFDGKSILYFKSCRGCKFTVNSRALKVFVEDCHSCTFVFAAGVTTGCFEVWNSSDSSFDFAKAAQSIQVDLSNSLRFRFTDRREHFGFLVWAGCEDLSLSLPPPSSASLSSSSSSSALSSLPPIPFSLPIPIPSFSSSATPLSFSSSASPLPPSFRSSSPISIPTAGATTQPTTEENKATKPTTFSMGLDFLPDRSTVDPRTDQFKVTLIDDELVNEPVTRLEGGYPSTQTESSVHQAKKRMRPTPSPSTSPSSSSPSSPSLASSPGLTSPLSLPALSLPSSLLSHLPASFTLPPPPPASPATTSPSTSLSSSPTSSKALPTVAEQENLISLLFAGWG